MKKSRQIVLGLMLIFVMALASGCGDGRNNTKSTESTRQSQSAISAESTEGGMANGPTNGTDARESTGVLDGLADDIKDCLLYTSPSPRDATLSRMPSSA